MLETQIGIFIDLSKAFDTLNHNILFDKLKNYSVRGVALQWLNRICITDHNMLYITACNLQSWELNAAPHKALYQVSFFLIYINDITNVSRLLQLLLFADDTNIFLEHRDIKALIEIVNSELVKLADWFPANRLSLNVSKTNFIMFCSSKK